MVTAMQHRLLAVVTVLVPGLAYAQPAGAPPAPPATGTTEGEVAPPPADAPPAEPPPAEPPPAVDAAPSPPPSDNAISAKYDKGLTFETADEKFELKASVRSQFRTETTKSHADGSEWATRFALPRLRLQLEGHAYGKDNGYKVEFDFANRGFSLLKDFYFDHAYGKVHLRAGQWKKPFNRQELVSDFGSDFLERSIVNEFSGAGRDLGVAVHNNYEKSPEGVEWAAGLFNGTGEKPSIKTTCTSSGTCTSGLPSNVPADWGPMLVGHVGYNHGGIKGYSEADLEGGPLRFAVALSYKLNLRNFAKDASGDTTFEHVVVADAMVKVEGIDITGAVAVKKDAAADAEVAFYGQGGFMLVPKKLLGSVRFAQVPVGEESLHEILGGIDWFLQGHNLKLMVDAGVLHTTGDTGGSDVQIRTQLQAVL